MIQTEENQIIYRDMVSPEIRGDQGTGLRTEKSRLGLKESLEAFEREMILKVIKKSGGNITRAAEELGITRQNLYFKINKYGIG